MRSVCTPVASDMSRMNCDSKTSRALVTPMAMPFRSRWPGPLSELKSTRIARSASGLSWAPDGRGYSMTQSSWKWAALVRVAAPSHNSKRRIVGRA